VEVFSGSIPGGELRQVLYCATVYVATDSDDRPRPVDTWTPETPGDMALAERVRAHVNAVRTA
jgi:acyl-CoA hydrolase